MATSRDHDRSETSGAAGAAGGAEPGDPGPPLRLQLWADPPGGRVDGAWWPRSRDLHAEVAHLVDDFPVVHGRVTRLLFSRPDWDVATRDGRSAWTVTGSRGPVRVGSFPSDDTRLMIAMTGRGRRLALLVIPSDTPALEAQRQLQGAAPDTSDVAPPSDLEATEWARWDTESPSW